MNEQEFFKYAYYLIVGPKDDAELKEFTDLYNQYHKIKEEKNIKEWLQLKAKIVIHGMKW